jgi:hypothetical protein
LGFTLEEGERNGGININNRYNWLMQTKNGIIWASKLVEEEGDLHLQYSNCRERLDWGKVQRLIMDGIMA